MPEQLCGQCLNWICLDRRGLLTAHLRNLLQSWVTRHRSGTTADVHPIRQRLVLHAAEWTGELWQQPLRSHLASTGLGLIAWSIEDIDEFEAGCASLRFARDAAHPVQRLCFLSPSLNSLTPIVLEAGAQSVVSQLPSLHTELSQLLTRVCLSSQGFHPLTSGLLERLPWQA